jgi:hypothetical protein
MNGQLRSLALVPVAAAALPAVLAYHLDDPAALGGAFLATALVAYALATAGAVSAALVFSRGEWLRRAWGLLAVSNVLLFPARLLRTPSAVALPGEAAASVLGPLVGIVSCLVGIAGIWMLGRTWARTGLPLPGTRATRVAVRAGAVALALAVMGGTFAGELRALAGGGVDAVEAVLGSLEHIVTLTVAAQLVWMGFAMRGGVARWPWTYLAASAFVLLGYDAWGAGPSGASPELVRTVDEVMRLAANGFVFAAGISQRLIVLPAARATPRREISADAAAR